MEKQADSVSILFELALNRLNAQIRRIDGIDTKIGVTFGLTNGITAALAAFVTFLPQPLTKLVLIFGSLSGLAYVVTLVLLLFSYRWGTWSFRPDLKTLGDICSDTYRNYPEVVKEWVADECVRSFETNQQRIINKVKLANLALIAVSSQGLFLAATFVSYLLN